MPFVPWVATTANAPTPLSVALGGTGAATAAGALADLGAIPWWTPADDGFLGADSDPAGASGSGTLTAGTLYLTRLTPRAATTITNLFYGVGTVGAGASTGTFVGLYSASGTLLSGSADQAANFTGSTGWKQLALTSAQAVAAGTTVFAAVLCNLATTQVSLLRQNNSVNAAAQATVLASTQRWGAFAAQGTALPASLTMGNMAATAFTNIVLWS